MKRVILTGAAMLLAACGGGEGTAPERIRVVSLDIEGIESCTGLPCSLTLTYFTLNERDILAPAAVVVKRNGVEIARDATDAFGRGETPVTQGAGTFTYEVCPTRGGGTCGMASMTFTN